MQLSIVIPAYNEEERLPKTLTLLKAFFRDGKTKEGMTLQEILVVDDGSTDGTVESARGWSDRLPLSVLSLPKNRGKGAALRAGVQMAKGEVILLYDADSATPIEEVPVLIAAMVKNGADIVIGSRVLQKERQVLTFMPWHRRLIGRLYHAICAPLVPGIHDAACGCKLFRRDVAQKLFSLQKVDRFAVDVEVLSLAHSFGYVVLEIPVHWTAIPESKVRLLRDGIEMLGCVICMYAARRQDSSFRTARK